MSENYKLLPRTKNFAPKTLSVARPHRTAMPPRARVVASDSNPQSQWLGIFGALRRHWRLSLAFMVVVVAVTAAVSFLLKPVYEPSAHIEVDPPGSEAFSMQTNNSSTPDIDNMIETQTQVLRSDELALALVRALHLESRPELVGKSNSSSKNADGVSGGENAALAYVQHNLKVVPLKNSRVIRIAFASHDPRVARDAVNSLLQLYIDNNYKTRFDAVTKSSEWLSRQLKDIKDKAERSTQALVDYQKQHGITDIDEKQNTVAQKVAGLNQQLTLAQSERIQLEALHRSIVAGEGGSLPQLRDNPVMQDLTKKVADTEAELSQLQVIYGEKHPNVQKLRQRLKALQEQLTGQRKYLVQGIETSYAAARARERLMAGQAQAATSDMNSMGEYGMLKKEAETSTALYNNLYARVKEAGIAAASKSSNIRVIEQARLLDKPTWPRPLQNIVLALLCGLVGGVMLALLRDRLDDSIRVPEEAMDFEGLPAIAFIPTIEGSSNNPIPLASPSKKLLPRSSTKPFVIARPTSNEAEAVRALLSSLLFSAGDHSRVLMVASPSPREGKTTVAVNLSCALAERDDTCLVEADLRRPSIERQFHVLAPAGLADVLTARASLNAAVIPCPRVPRLFILGAGRKADNPGALLMSNKLMEVVDELRARYSYVVIDTPPLLAYADARALAPLADGVVLVARQRQTARDAVGRSIELLTQVQARLLGFVLNDVDHNSSYYKYYGAGYNS